VDNDQTLATRHVLDHFASQGCTQPALLTTPPGQSYVDDVVAAYEDWCAEHRCKPLIERVSPPATEAAALPAALLLLSRAPRPDGIYATLDRTAIGIVQAAERLGLSIPNDLLVAAVTDSPLLAAANPPVTALALNAPEIGRRAVQLLIEELEHPDGSLQSITVPSTLIVRASSLRRPTQRTGSPDQGS
jgi:DNA-binding LacI/PurR family transcriptional regulator